MGTRGSSSHRGGGVGGGVRTGRDQLAEWTSNENALQQILRDTGYTLEQARIAQNYQIRYYGSDYDNFTEGSLPHETEVISEALMRMPYYNAGPIWRGVSFPDDVAENSFLHDWKPGTTQIFTDKLGRGRPVIQSFTSDEIVAEEFGNWEFVGIGKTSIKFIMTDNKTAPGVQHISHFGASEAEVLLPSFQQVYVEKVVQVSDSNFGGRRFEIYLRDKGRKKK